MFEEILIFFTQIGMCIAGFWVLMRVVENLPQEIKDLKKVIARGKGRSA